MLKLIADVEVRARGYKYSAVQQRAGWLAVGKMVPVFCLDASWCTCSFLGPEPARKPVKIAPETSAAGLRAMEEMTGNN